jgi:G protein beta subunit-like protein
MFSGWQQQGSLMYPLEKRTSYIFSQGQCYVWKVNDEISGLPRFQAVTRFSAHGKYLTRCLLSPDARYVIPCGGKRWLECRSSFRYLATCSADTTVKVWSISPNYDFKQEKVLIGHQRWVWDCAFSADSAYLVTGYSD